MSATPPIPTAALSLPARTPEGMAGEAGAAADGFEELLAALFRGAQDFLGRKSSDADQPACAPCVAELFNEAGFFQAGVALPAAEPIADRNSRACALPVVGPLPVAAPIAEDVGEVGTVLGGVPPPAAPCIAAQVGEAASAETGAPPPAAPVDTEQTSEAGVFAARGALPVQPEAKALQGPPVRQLVEPPAPLGAVDRKKHTSEL